LLGFLPGHAESIGIVEAQRPAHANAVFREGAAKGIFALKVAARQDLGADRPGVLGVNVDLSLEQRLP
jgi:hypothetical protein